MPLPSGAPGPGPAPNRRGGVTFGWGLGVFLMALAWSRGELLFSAPIGRSEEHLAIGQRLYRTGSLAALNDPGVLRPPGYPSFVAATLHIRDLFAAVGGSDPKQAGSDEDAVLWAQCLLLAATATVIFAFGATVLPPLEAACVGLVFAWGPISVALLGLHSYHLLHTVGLTVGTAQLALAARASPQSPRGPLLAGILWGMATLVRPVSLILPPFVFLLARLRRGGAWRSAAAFALLFTLGMAAPILPYTVRNYRLTGRLVLVNVQGGFALWATTARRLKPEEEFLDWNELWKKRGLILYRGVTGQPKYDIATFSTHVFELEDAFKSQALRNLQRRPSVYLHNVADNLWGFCRDPVTKWPRIFAGRNQLSRSRNRFFVSAYSLVLLLLALPGIVRGLWRRDALASTVFLSFAALAVAHAFTFLDERYTYVKVPLLAMGFALTLATLEDRSILRWRLAAVLAVTMLMGSALVTLYLLGR